MPKHETISCPRCRSHFECKVGTVLQCQCAKIDLSEAERRFIQEQYQGCLCLACMQALQQSYHKHRIARLLMRLKGVQH